MNEFQSSNKSVKDQIEKLKSYKKGMQVDDLKYLLQDKYQIIEQLSIPSQKRYISYIVERINCEDKKLDGKRYIAKIEDLVERRKNAIGKVTLEKKARSALILEEEIEILLDIERNIDKIGFPKAYDVYSLDERRVFITDLRSIKLTKLIPLIINNLNIQRYVKLCMKMIYDILDRIESIHRANYIHQYLRPQFINFKRQQSQKDTLFIADYSKAQKFNQYNIKNQNYHKPYAFGIKPKGRNGYASVWSHTQITKSRRDDLQSFCYICIFLLRGGSLPWDDTEFGVDEKKDKEILQKKLKVIDSNIFETDEPSKQNTFQNILDFIEGISIKSQMAVKHDKRDWKVPKQILQILIETRNLSFEEQPNYNYIRKLIKKAMNRYDTVQTEEYYFPIPDKVLYPLGC